jgi:hypothetical protein
MVIMALDLAGNISLTLSIVSLFLLVLGIPLVRDLKNAENFRRHGYLTIVALAIETILVFIVMIPSFTKNFDAVLSLSLLSGLDTWLHFGLGVVAEVAGFVYVVMWLAFSPSTMQCMRFRRYMMPTFIIWIIAVISGALIHLLQLF